MATIAALPATVDPRRAGCEQPPESWEFDDALQRCPLCRSSDLRRFDQDYLGRRVDRCADCHLLFMNPQYSEAYLQRYYARYYDDQEAAAERLPAAESLPAAGPTATTRQVAAKQARLELLGRHVNPGRLLCIGCGNGLELLLARRLGWRPEGFDVDAQYIDDLRGRLDFPLYCGRWEDLRLPSAAYDAVFMDQVLEHPKRPQAYLREVHRLLRPGGVLLVACPNLGSVANRTKTLLGRWGLKRRRGKHYDLFHHLFLYRPRGLARIMRRHFDFEIVTVQGDPDGGRRERRSLSLDPWRRRLPWLESSFCLLARKPVTAASAEGTRPEGTRAEGSCAEGDR